MVGNPNSGKTALFNALTGSRQKVANYRILLRRARTIIFSMMMVIWFLCSDAPEPAINYSLAAGIGKVVEPVLRPVGFNWQIDIALIPGMAAREVAVAALGTLCHRGRRR